MAQSSSFLLPYSYLWELAGIYLTVIVCIKAFEHDINQLLLGNHAVLVFPMAGSPHVSFVMQIQNLVFQPPVVAQSTVIIWRKKEKANWLDDGEFIYLFVVKNAIRAKGKLYVYFVR